MVPRVLTQVVKKGSSAHGGHPGYLVARYHFKRDLGRSRLGPVCRAHDNGELATDGLAPIVGVDCGASGVHQMAEHRAGAFENLLTEHRRQSGLAPRYGQMGHQLAALGQGLVDQVFQFIDQFGRLFGHSGAVHGQGSLRGAEGAGGATQF